MPHAILSDGENRRYYINTIDDYEFVRPLEKFMQLFIPSNIRLHKMMVEASAATSGAADIPAEVWMKVLHKNAVEKWKEKAQELMNTQTPQALWALLEAGSKKDQIKVLRGLSLTWDEFFAFVCQAGENLGYSYSSYKVHLNHKGLDHSKLPKIIRLRKDNTVETVGSTPLTQGQLKQVITERKVINAKFLDKGDDWHCFFYTYKSIEGKENYQGEQPHIHYISSKWGIPRADVLAAIRSGSYKSTSVHINIDKLRQDEDDEE
jgi:hypothetical protein